MAEKAKYHPLITQAFVTEARQYFRPDVTEAEISQMLSDTFDMLGAWSEPEVQ